MSKKDKEVATTSQNLPAEMQGFFEDSMGNADSDSFAIPFLTVLQSNSPQCDPDDPACIEGARKGLIFNTVTFQMHETLEVFPVLFRRQYIEWVLRSQGGGLVNRYNPEDAPVYEDTEVEGKMLWLMENGHQLVDTRQHYVLFRELEGTWNPAMIGMASSQIKVSKRIMTMLGEQRKAGILKTFKFGTRGESNEKGSWAGWTAQPLNDVVLGSDLLNEATEFQAAVKAGEVEVQGEESVSAGKGSGEAPINGFD